VAFGPSAASFECGVDLLWLACAIGGSVHHLPRAHMRPNAPSKARCDTLELNLLQ
jgi:hypothetical protein